jgi:hypothetical protein
MRLRAILTAGMAAITLVLSGCSPSQPASSQSQPTEHPPAPSKPAAPDVPAEIQSAADAALGSDTDVLLFGDLAKDGHQQALAVNRFKATPQTSAVGTLVTRVVVIENDAGKWKELFRCDEHLKNTRGYLGGTPLAGVNGWRLQYEQDAAKGLQLYFTPLEKPTGGYIQTLAVRWNPKTKRYQSLDRNYEQFLGEVPSLETPQSQLR